MQKVLEIAQNCFRLVLFFSIPVGYIYLVGESMKTNPCAAFILIMSGPIVPIAMGIVADPDTF